MLFNWLRSQARAAVLAGVTDAIEEIDHGTNDTGNALALLRSRLTPTLPAPAVEASAGGQVESNGQARSKRKSAE